MDNEKSQDEGPSEEAYLASYESANRKRKTLIVTLVVVGLVVVVFAFIRTLGSLGKMNEDVHGAFNENGAAETPASETEPEPEATPDVQDEGANVPPAESATPAPQEDGTPAPADEVPAPAEPSPNPEP